MDDVIFSPRLSNLNTHQDLATKQIKTLKIRRRNSLIFGLITVCVVSIQLGCTTMDAVMAPYQLQANRSQFELRTRLRARKLWKTSHLTSCYQSEPGNKDIRRGFIDGFLSVCMGGNGCPPPVAASGRTCFRFGNPYSTCRTNAWMEGFPLGAAAAESCGCQKWAACGTTHHHTASTPYHVEDRNTHHSSCQCVSCLSKSLQNKPQATGGVVISETTILSTETAANGMSKDLSSSKAEDVILDQRTTEIEYGTSVPELPVIQKTLDPLTEPVVASIDDDLQPSWAPKKNLSELIRNELKLNQKTVNVAQHSPAFSDLIQENR